MSVVLIGSNPGLLLHRDDHPVAFASVWSVEWSRWGTGTAMVVATEDGWLTAGADEHFARILLDRFTRHFPESEGFEWDGRVQHVPGRPKVHIDAAKGMRASAPGITVDITDVLDRRHIVEPSFTLGTATVSLSNVYLPCAQGTITLDGEALDGAPAVGGTPERPTSSAYLAIAEVWVDSHGALGLPTARPSADLARRRHLRSLRPSL